MSRVIKGQAFVYLILWYSIVTHFLPGPEGLKKFFWIPRGYAWPPSCVTAAAEELPGPDLVPLETF